MVTLDVTRSRNTYIWYESLSRVFVKQFGKLDISNVRPDQVTNLGMSQKQWGSNSKHNAVRCIKRIYKWAKQNGLIENNPIEHMERPPQEAQETCVSPDQMALIESSLPDGPFKDLMILAWDTGMRPQELFRLDATFNRFWNFTRIMRPDGESPKRGADEIRVVLGHAHVVNSDYVVS